MIKASRKLGEMLVESGIVTADQLSTALEKQKTDRKLLGEIIVDLGFVTKEKLDTALARQYGSKLGEILIAKGLITFENLKRVMVEQESTHKSLGEILSERGYVAEADLIEGLSSQYHMPYVKIADYEINPEAVSRVPLDALKKHCVFPIDIQDNMLVVATSNPEDFMAEADLKFLSGMYVKFVLASKSEIQSYLE